MSMSAGSRFREILAKNGLVEAMAAHSPLSAMLVAEAGFDAIWASGFELSAMYGVPDVSIVSMTQHLDMTRAMADRTGLPIVADIDTGFGHAINVKDYEHFPETPISNHAEFEKQWKVLKGTEPIPKLDFTKVFVRIWVSKGLKIEDFGLRADYEGEEAKYFNSIGRGSIYGYSYGIGVWKRDYLDVVDGKIIIVKEKP